MEEVLQTQLKQTRDSFLTLKNNFQHNLKVIKELQQENQLMQNELDRQANQNEIANTQFRNTTLDYEDQMANLSKEFQFRTQEMKIQNEKQMQSMVEQMNDKMRSEIAFLHKKYTRDNESLKDILSKTEHSQKALVLENHKLLDTIKELKLQRQTIEQQLRQIQIQKQAMITKYQLYQQQLQGMRSSRDQWEEQLRNKIKDRQKQKQFLQQQLSEMTLQYKDKIAKVKQQQGKKLIKITQQKQEQARKILQDSKEIKYKFENIASEHSTLKIELQKKDLLIRNYEEKQRKLENDKQRNKETDFLKKLHEQEKLFLHTEIQTLKEQNKIYREDIKALDERRQESQLKLERLKAVHMQKLNQIKKYDEELKAIRKRSKLHQQPQKYDQIEQSRLFSQDQGAYDELFWQKSQKMHPQNQPSSPVNVSSKPQYQLMKRIGELQVENDRYKDIIKKMDQELDRIKNTLDDKMDLKDKQIRLTKEQNHILREKINDKESQILNQKQTNNNLQVEIQSMLSFKEDSSKRERQLKEVIQKQKQTQRQVESYKELYEGVKSQIDNIISERDTLQIISSQLKAELNELKEKIRSKQDFEEVQSSSYEVEEQIGFNTQLSNRRQSHAYERGHGAFPQEQDHQENPSSQARHGQNVSYPNQRGSKKLYDLIQEKKKLQLVGKKAHVQIKTGQRFIAHVGTDSQKHIYQKIKEKNKTPPTNIPNYNAMRRDNDFQE